MKGRDWSFSWSFWASSIYVAGPVRAAVGGASAQATGSEDGYTGRDDIRNDDEERSCKKLMEPLSPERLEIIEELARRYGVSTTAVTTLLEAVISGQGTMAQFSHPELGGPGQWAQGGITMIGDMFNNALKPELCTQRASRAVVPFG